MKQKHFIDSHKGLNAVAVLALMFWYGAWDNTVAWIYLALHGTYGFLWIWKSQSFPDKQWEQKTGLAYGLVIWATLTLYWVSPWLIVSGRAQVPPPWYLAMCISMYTVGVFLHFSADMQKHTSLTLRPGVLITESLWARVRNPNYLGELLIYAGFSLLPMHWAPMAVLLLIVGAVWVPNMLRKDKSLSRYQEFAAYRARSGRILPRLF